MEQDYMRASKEQFQGETPRRESLGRRRQDENKEVEWVQVQSELSPDLSKERCQRRYRKRGFGNSSIPPTKLQATMDIECFSHPSSFAFLIMRSIDNHILVTP